MEYAVTVVFDARDSEHAAAVLDRCSEIAEDGAMFLGGWGDRYVSDEDLAIKLSEAEARVAEAEKALREIAELSLETEFVTERAILESTRRIAVAALTHSPEGVRPGGDQG